MATSAESFLAAEAHDLPTDELLVGMYCLCRYGAPETDAGQYQHWNHEVLPHWNAQERDKYTHGTQL
jgi:hypothetical protein